MKRLEWHPSKDLVVDSSISGILPCSNEGYRVNGYIPSHLVTEILLRTACVKSVVRFKTVCKAWYALIDDPDFIDRCLNRTTKFNILYATLFMERDDFGLTSVEEDIDREWISNCKDLNMSSCNGLTCLFENSYMYVCNPTTLEFINISGFRCDESCCGFGFDAKTNQFKVVQLKNFRRWTRFVTDFVYTLGKSKTRRILEEDVPLFNWFYDLSSTFIDGSICWIVIDRELRKSVLCFDVRDESFRLIEVPEGCWRWVEDQNIIHKKIIHNSLVECEGKICFAEQNSAKETLDLWMLKDSAKEMNTFSWTKKYNIVANDVTNFCSTYATPLCIHDTKILLRLASGELVSYDTDNEKCKVLFKLQDKSYVIVYNESLINLRDMMLDAGCRPFSYIRAYKPEVTMAITSTEGIISSG